mgnify:CR=1 FL=1
MLKDPENKILVGPLFNVEYQKRLIEYTNKYPNIKKLVASDSAYKNIVYEFGLDVKTINKNDFYLFKKLISSFLMPKTGAGRECDLLECEKEELKAQPLLSCFENLNS